MGSYLRVKKTYVLIRQYTSDLINLTFLPAHHLKKSTLPYNHKRGGKLKTQHVGLRKCETESWGILPWKEPSDL